MQFKIYILILLVSTTGTFCSDKKLHNSIVQCKKIVPIAIEGTWQKTSVKAAPDGSIYCFTMPIEGPDNYSSIHHFVSYNNITSINPTTLQADRVSSRFYDAKREVYVDVSKPYPHEPTYVGEDPTNAHQCKSLWLDNHELTDRLDTFPNNSLVIAHVWGGIELHKKNEIKQFMTGNSISAASCAPNNKYIALGSCDGTITIIDVTQEADPTPSIPRNFERYFGDKHNDEKYPLILASHQLSNKQPITTLQHSSDGTTILFASGNTIYQMQYMSKTNESIKRLCIKTLFDADETTNITCFTQIDNIVACVSDDNNIRFINKSNNEIQLIAHETTINSICSYTANENHYIITGDMQGNVIIWNVGTSGITNNMQLHHKAPVYHVEVTSDNKYIVVKTTQDVKIDNWTRKEDNVILYPTPTYLQDFIKEQTEKLNSITMDYNNNLNNPQELYKLLYNNQTILYTQENDTTVVNLRKKIEEQIIQCYKNQDFVKSIDSLEKLVRLLNSFPGTKLDQPTIVHLSGMNHTQQLNLLTDIDKIICTTLKNLTVTILTKELAKQPSNIEEHQKNIFNIAVKLFSAHFSHNNDNKSAELDALIDTLLPMYKQQYPGYATRQKKSENQQLTGTQKIISFVTRNKSICLTSGLTAILLVYFGYHYFITQK